MSAQHRSTPPSREKHLFPELTSEHLRVQSKEPPASPTNASGSKRIMNEIRQLVSESKNPVSKRSSQKGVPLSGLPDIKLPTQLQPLLRSSASSPSDTRPTSGSYSRPMHPSSASRLRPSWHSPASSTPDAIALYSTPPAAIVAASPVRAGSAVRRPSARSRLSPYSSSGSNPPSVTEDSLEAKRSAPELSKTLPVSSHATPHSSTHAQPSLSSQAHAQPDTHSVPVKGSEKKSVSFETPAPTSAPSKQRITISLAPKEKFPLGAMSPSDKSPTGATMQAISVEDLDDDNDRCADDNHDYPPDDAFCRRCGALNMDFTPAGTFLLSPSAVVSDGERLAEEAATDAFGGEDTCPSIPGGVHVYEAGFCKHCGGIDWSFSSTGVSLPPEQLQADKVKMKRRLGVGLPKDKEDDAFALSGAVKKKLFTELTREQAEICPDNGAAHVYDENGECEACGWERAMLDQLESEHDRQWVMYETEPFESKYALGKQVGQAGAFGTCFECKHLGTQVTYCVKRISKYAIENQIELDNLRAEILINERLNHKNICQFREFFEDTSTVWLVMERLAGGELFEAMEQSRTMSERVAAIIIRQVCQALEYMHSQGFAHCDIKPDNCIFMDDTSPDCSPVKLVDFGYSQQLPTFRARSKASPIAAAPRNLKKGARGPKNIHLNNPHSPVSRPSTSFHPHHNTDSDGVDLHSMPEPQRSNDNSAAQARDVLTRPIGLTYCTAPEVFSGEYSERIDMWSVGIMTFMMLFGFAPFNAGNQDPQSEAGRKVIKQKILAGFEPVSKPGTGAFFPLNRRGTSNSAPDGTGLPPISDAAKDFISQLLISSPQHRMTSSSALKHPWLMSITKAAKGGKNDTVFTGTKRLKTSTRKFFKSSMAILLERQLSQEDIDLVKAAFTAMDSNGDGFISVDEILAHRSSAAVSPFLQRTLDSFVSGHLVALPSSSNNDGLSPSSSAGGSFSGPPLTPSGTSGANGAALPLASRFSYDEVLMNFLLQQLNTSEEVATAIFQSMDANGDGILTFEEIDNALAKHQIVARAAELRRALKSIDLDRTGGISLDEFLTCVRSN